MRKKVFVTGAGGCVGHYLFDKLSKERDLDLFLLIRNPNKVKYDLSGVTVVQDEFKNIEAHRDILNDMDLVVHLLADWGGEEGNFDETIKMLGCLNREKLERLIYFSTASILGKDSRPTSEVLSCGTPYIRGKYKMYESLKKLAVHEKTTVLFPTWVLGGDSMHPYSHAYEAIKRLKDWKWAIRYITSDLTFHFIHARDIASVTSSLLRNSARYEEYVLGTKPVTAGDLIRETCNYLEVPHRPLFNLSKDFMDKASFLLRNRMSPWDEYCVRTFHQEFKAVSPDDFGLKTNYPTLRTIIEDIFGAR